MFCNKCITDYKEDTILFSSNKKLVAKDFKRVVMLFYSSKLHFTFYLNPHHLDKAQDMVFVHY